MYAQNTRAEGADTNCDDLLKKLSRSGVVKSIELGNSIIE